MAAASGKEVIQKICKETGRTSLACAPSVVLDYIQGAPSSVRPSHHWLGFGQRIAW